MPKRYAGAAIAAGALGGLISAVVKLGWEVVFPPRAPNRSPEPAVLITMVTHQATPDWQTYAVHFAFSIGAGALYGGLVEFFPIVALGMGAAYGIAVWIGAHEIAMPAIGLTPPAAALPLTEQLSEFFGHALWGFVIEVFRHDFRGRFVRRARRDRGAPLEAL